MQFASDQQIQYSDQFNELISKVPILHSSVPILIFSINSESNNLLTTRLYDRLRVKPQTTLTKFSISTAIVLFLLKSHSARWIFFSPWLHILCKLATLLAKFWALYGHLQSAWGFLPRYWCHKAFQNSLKYKETGGIPPQLL